jgi:hypothetical protein
MLNSAEYNNKAVMRCYFRLTLEGNAELLKDMQPPALWEHCPIVSSTVNTIGIDDH